MALYRPNQASNNGLTLQQLASTAAACFTTTQRPDSGDYVALLDGSPDWVSALVREAHGHTLPDDWRYASIESALAWIADGNDPEDEQYEWADANVDAYHSGRLAWLASDGSRPNYCDDATSEMGDYAPNGILDRIGLGQHQESCEVFASVLRSLHDRAQTLK